MWVDSLKDVQAKPESKEEWAQQAEEMTQRMNDAQRQLWGNCFAALKKADLGKMPGSCEHDGQKIFQNWQEATRKAMEAQLEWASSWNEAVEHHATSMSPRIPVGCGNSNRGSVS